jgi:hypothetical protein
VSSLRAYGEGKLELSRDELFQRIEFLEQVVRQMKANGRP